MLVRELSIVAAFSIASLAAGQPLTPAFTYQGELSVGGAPSTGTYDFRFRLFDALSGGGQVGATLCADNVAVDAGRFVATLDFGAQFSGAQRFLEMDVRQDTGLSCANAAGFTTLGGRQPLTAAPFASYSASAGSATTSANSTSLNGQPASFYTNAANLSAGTISDARLSANVAQLSANGVFSGIPAFNGGVSGASAPFAVDSTFRVANLNADLLDGLDSAAFATAAHTHDAAAVSSGTLADARLSSNIPRLSSTANFLSGGSFGSAVGVGTSAPTSLLELRTADPQLRVRNTNDVGGGVILNTFGSLQLGMFNPSAAVWGVVPAGGYRAVLALDNQGRVGSVTNTGAGPAFRNVLDDGSGRFGIGTSSPAAPLDVRVNATQGLQLRLDGGLVPGLNVVGGGGNAGILRFRNSLEVHASDDGTRAGYLDVRNTSGATTIALHGATGNIAANNLSAVKGVQTFTESREAPRGFISQGQFAVLDTVAATAPANGYYMIFATLTCHIDTTALLNGKASMELKLDENTPGQSGILTNTRFTCKSGDHDGSSLHIVWTKPVTAGTTYTFQTSTYLYRDYGSGVCSGHYWSSSLHLLFVPNALP